MPLGWKLDWSLLLFDNFTDHKTMLRSLYIDKRKGMEEIGEILGIDKSVVRRELEKMGVKIRPKGRPRFIDMNYYTIATMTIIRKAIKLGKED